MTLTISEDIDNKVRKRKLANFKKKYGASQYTQVYMDMVISEAFKTLGVASKDLLLIFLLKRRFSYKHKPPIYINKDKIFLTWKEFKEPPFEWRPGRFGIAKKQLLERGFIKRIHQGGSCKKDKSIYGESDDWRRWVKGMDFSPKPDVKRGYQGAFNCNLIQNTHGKIRAIHTREKKSLEREFG